MSTQQQQKQDSIMWKAEWDIVDALIAWKKDADRLSQSTAGARAAIARAKELKIWEVKGYPDFKSWLAGECDITERWAYSLLSSAQTIRELEEAAAGSKALAPLTHKKNLAALRAMPDKAITKLKRLAPQKAAKAALAAIEKARGVPTVEEVAFEVARFAPPVSERKDSVLEALDGEWKAIQVELADGELPARLIYKRLRLAVARAL